MFVKSTCEKCGGPFEFEYEHRGEVIQCPHCQQPTTLTVPEWKPPQPEKHKSHHEPSPARHDPATPKQIAFLKSMGFAEAGKLSKDGAHDLIQGLWNTENPSERERQNELGQKWLTERLYLYPDLYRAELYEHLTPLLHEYVRSQIVGASEKLTREKIIQVMDAMRERDPNWCRDGRRNKIFFQELQLKYPGCCDGRKPQKASLDPLTLKAVAPKAGGCLVLVIFFLLVGAICYGCKSPSQQTAQRYPEQETEQVLERRIINAVRTWYGAGDEKARILVERRSASGWLLEVGPEMKATTVQIDPTTLKVVKVWRGY